MNYIPLEIFLQLCYREFCEVGSLLLSYMYIIQETRLLDISFTTDEDPNDESFEIECDHDSIHPSALLPPFRCSRTVQAVSVPQKVCFMDLTQLDKFIKQLNEMRMCATQGCKGELTPVKVSTFGFGGAVSIKYNCKGCGKHEAHFETSSKN